MMTVEERLDAVAGFVLQNPTSTEADCVVHLVSLGDTQAHAEAAMPQYIQFLIGFGYITTPTYEAMRDWANTISVQALMTAKAALMDAYNAEIKKEERRLDLQEQITAVEEAIADIPEPTPEDLERAWEAFTGIESLQGTLAALQAELESLG